MIKKHFYTLNSDAKLFVELKESNPIWWQFIKEQIKGGHFYVDIRKDNSLNVYYNGGSLLRVMYSKGEIKAKIRPSYLGLKGSQYLDFELASLTKEVEEIMKRIEKRYSDFSENGIKARLISEPQANYIDSEFAYAEPIGKKKDNDGKELDIYRSIRIDLVKLEKGNIVFVELKRIQDPRLLTREYEHGTPEVLQQLETYAQFIKSRKEEITHYYKTLFNIKRELEILPKGLASINNLDDYTLCEEVELYIEPYASLNAHRMRRLRAIQTLLDHHNITHNL